MQKPCRGFAWPCGVSTQGTIDLLRENGFAYGRTTQNLLKFAAKVARESRNVISCEITPEWKYYTATSSIRTNLALQLQSVCM